MERLYAFNVSVSNGNLKCPIGKPIFAVNLPLKLLRVTVANANTESLKSLHTSFYTYLDCMLCEIWTKSYGSKWTQFDLLDKTPSSLKKKTFLIKSWRHFVRRFCGWNNNYLMVTYQFSYYHFSMFHKLW